MMHICESMVSHHLQNKQLVRDCDIKSTDGGNVQHKCFFQEVKVITNMNKEEMKDMFFKFVDKAFWKLEFGYNVHRIYGCSPGEPLHINKCGLNFYQSATFIYTLSAPALRFLQGSVRETVKQIEE